MNAYGNESVSWSLPKSKKEEEIYELSDTSERPPVKDVVRTAMSILAKHPDAALLAYRLLSQRFAISG